MSDIAEVLGKNIRNLRRQFGWTQEKLAEKAGISVPFMTQIELARKTASLDVIASIAKALGVSYAKLFQADIAESGDLVCAMHLLENDLTNAIVGEIHSAFENLKL